MGERTSATNLRGGNPRDLDYTGGVVYSCLFCARDIGTESEGPEFKKDGLKYYQAHGYIFLAVYVLRQNHHTYITGFGLLEPTLSTLHNGRANPRQYRKLTDFFVA